MYTTSLFSTAYTMRCSASILLNQYPCKFALSGSGFPIPSKGCLSMSFTSRFIRFSCFLSVSTPVLVVGPCLIGEGLIHLRIIRVAWPCRICAGLSIFQNAPHWPCLKADSWSRQDCYIRLWRAKPHFRCSFW